jgi:3,8-divinyl chlorophyllide a/chlorophyllide a reductase subunit X
VINRDDGTGEAAKFADAVDIPVLARIPMHEDIRRKSANYQIIGTMESEWGPMFAELADNIAGSQPHRPAPLSQDDLIGLFDGRDTGQGVVLVPATDADMRGKHYAPKPSLEVVYDDV